MDFSISPPNNSNSTQKAPKIMKNRNFFADLPSHIVVEIFSRLSPKITVQCKCVCKYWLDLITDTEFASLHSSRSSPGLVIYLDGRRDSLQIFDFVDELDLEHHELHYNPVIEFDPVISFNLPGSPVLHCSANGLLFLLVEGTDHVNPLYICNPITREFIEILDLDKRNHYFPERVTYGFGVSKTTNQLKVVRIFDHCILDELLEISNLDCQVYTIRTGSWRSIDPGAPLRYGRGSVGAFFNGRLHWLVRDLRGTYWNISCLDLETECFSTFSCPNPLPDPESERSPLALVVLGDYLCLCDNSSDDEIVIWLMKEYGVENSWRREFVISKPPDMAGEYHKVVYPLKVFKDGDILMAWGDSYLFYYSHKSKSVHRKIDMFELQSPYSMDPMVHKSSFVSLRSFGAENVRPF